jgi:NO-binding membrane sensor protein with MHYT domain
MTLGRMNASEWDNASGFERVMFVLSLLMAVALTVVGIVVMVIGSRTSAKLFGGLVVLWDVGYLVYQYRQYKLLLRYRQAGG